MKKLQLSKLNPILPVTTFLAIPALINTVFAAGASTTDSIIVDSSALGFTIPTLGTFLGFAIRLFFVLAGLAALFFMLTGALAWVTSGGEKDKVDAAQKKITAAVIGVILIIVVLAIIATLENVVFKQHVCFGLTCPLTIPDILH